MALLLTGKGVQDAELRGKDSGNGQTIAVGVGACHLPMW